MEGQMDVCMEGLMEQIHCKHSACMHKSIHNFATCAYEYCVTSRKEMKLQEWMCRSRVPGLKNCNEVLGKLSDTERSVQKLWISFQYNDLRGKAPTVFDRSNNRSVGSNPTRSMTVCTRVSVMLSCAGRSLAMGCSPPPLQGVLQNTAKDSHF